MVIKAIYVTGKKSSQQMNTNAMTWVHGVFFHQIFELIYLFWVPGHSVTWSSRLPILINLW